MTGEVNLEKGTHGLMGDAVNTASRILGLARTGEILVGYETFRQSEGYFDFEKLDAAKVKGKAAPVPVYRMVSLKEKPVTIRRLSGLKAALIGRKAEMHFNKAIELSAEIGARGLLAQAHLGLASSTGQRGERRRPGKASPGPLTSSGNAAGGFLKQAREALAKLG